MGGSRAGAGVPPGRVGSPAVEGFGCRRLSRTTVVRARLRPGSTPAPAMCAGTPPPRPAWWWVGFALCALALGCGAAARLTRVEGDGGWSAARRAEEVAHLAAAPSAEAAPAGPLTLAAALALAARGNRRIAEAEEQLDVARARVWETRGRLLPATTGSGRYTWYTDAQTTRVHLPPGLLPAGTTPPDVTVRQAEFGTVNGTLRLPLDLSGELQHTLAAAQAGYRGERARLWATRLAEQVGVIRAYFQLLEAERLAEVTEQTIATDRQQLANAGQRFAAGRLTKNELLVVQVALRNAEEQRLQRALAIDQARWTLNQAVGLPVDAPSEVVDVRERPALPAADEALRLARATNPVLVSLLEEQQRLEESTRALVSSRLPRFDAGGAIDYSSASIVQPRRVGSGFVDFTWDLGTDTRREAEIAAARHAAEQNRIAVARELDELEAAVRTTQRAAEERLAAAAAAEAGVAQAEENLRIRRQQFDAGRATSDDVLDAEALLAAQRATRAGALYQAHTRRAELQELLGLPLDDVVADTR
ncbi:MAG: TolC family protein [Deltaproteobacteria bacterium]|nr:MAG: TolC family protein [Deltaproteobacteria bacterium]